MVGFFYTATGPDSNVALWHFRVFFISRLLHTLCYQVLFNLHFSLQEFRFYFEIF